MGEPRFTFILNVAMLLVDVWAERDKLNFSILQRLSDEISHAKKLDNNEDDEQIFTLLKVLWEFSSFSDGSLEQPPFMKIIVRQQS